MVGTLPRMIRTLPRMVGTLPHTTADVPFVTAEAEVATRLAPVVTAEAAEAAVAMRLFKTCVIYVFTYADHTYMCPVIVTTFNM